MPYLRVSVLVPTRRRIERLKVLLSSYDETTEGLSVLSELVFRVDDDDVETQVFLGGRGHTVVIGPRLEGYRSLPTFFNEMAARATGDVLMCGNDDMVFRTHRWAARILRTADAYLDGVFNIGVQTHNQDHYPFSTVSRRVVEALGFIWDPRIYWGDIYLRDVMASVSRTRMLDDVHIEHDWAGNSPDATFVEGNQNDIYRRDPTYWIGTHTQAVGDAVAKVRELMI